MTNTTLVLNYLGPVSLCYNYSFLCDILFIHPDASIGALEKSLFELGDFPEKHPFWSPLQYSSTFAGLLGV